LNLHYNNIGENGAKFLGEGVSKCVTLTSLILILNVNNNIGDNGAKYLGEGISKCVTLTSLKLDLRITRTSRNGERKLA